MSKMTNKFAPEVCVRAMRMVVDHECDYPSRSAAVVSSVEKIGCVPQMLHEWVKKTEAESDKRAPILTEFSDKVKVVGSGGPRVAVDERNSDATPASSSRRNQSPIRR